MKLIRNIPFVIWFYGFLASIEPIKKSIKKYREEGNREMERAEIRRAEDAWGQALVKKAGIDLRVSFSESLPEGPVVFVSNHQSYWDIPVFFAAVRDRQIGFVAKESLRKVPKFGSWIADVRSVFIKRDDARASLRAIEEGVELLKQGYSLVIFPEGTRAKGVEMKEFKKGSLRLAVKAEVPVVPVTLNGTYHAFEEKGYVSPARVDFVVHPPIHTKGLSRKEAADLAAQVENIVRAGLEEIR
ncbi:MAG TPA: lysophospholipid acyltransferase family protein [Bacillota bacterium]|nr:lysophospholipid acyltransferase family protein [Bacillota bacterium]HPZ59121.1 lysophospholipid acyltransferase family protein [Bacillota bacterium]